MLTGSAPQCDRHAIPIDYNYQICGGPTSVFGAAEQLPSAADRSHWNFTIYLVLGRSWSGTNLGTRRSCRIINRRTMCSIQKCELWLALMDEMKAKAWRLDRD
jgi:hypothetical protein